MNFGVPNSFLHSSYRKLVLIHLRPAGKDFQIIFCHFIGTSIPGLKNCHEELTFFFDKRKLGHPLEVSLNSFINESQV